MDKLAKYELTINCDWYRLKMEWNNTFFSSNSLTDKIHHSAIRYYFRSKIANHYIFGKVCCQLPGSSDFTLKSLLPVNWQQRFYDEVAAAS